MEEISCSKILERFCFRHKMPLNRPISLQKLYLVFKVKLLKTIQQFIAVIQTCHLKLVAIFHLFFSNRSSNLRREECWRGRSSVGLCIFFFEEEEEGCLVDFCFLLLGVGFFNNADFAWGILKLIGFFNPLAKCKICIFLITFLAVMGTAALPSCCDYAAFSELWSLPVILEICLLLALICIC